MKGKQKCGAVGASLEFLASALRAAFARPGMGLRPIPIRATPRRRG